MSKVVPGPMTPGKEAKKLIVTAAVHRERLQRWLTEPAFRADPQPASKGFARQADTLFAHLEKHLPEQDGAVLTGHSRSRAPGARFQLLVQVLIKVLGKADGMIRAGEVREKVRAYRAALAYLQTREGAVPTDETLTELANVFADIERRGDGQRANEFAYAESPLLRKKNPDEDDEIGD